MALLTVLVPLAISILTNPKKEKFEKLDFQIILKEIFNIKYLLISLFLIFISLSLWEILCREFRFIGLFLFVIGIIVIVYFIWQGERWLKGDVFKFRFKYLENLKASKKYDDLIIVWRSVWETKNRDSENEKHFFEIFAETIRGLFEKKVAKKLSEKYENDICTHPLFKLFKDYEDLIDNRNLWSLAEDQFSTLLDWHFERWEIKKKIEKKEKEASRPNPGFSAHLNALLLGFLNRILKKALKRTLLEEELGRETKSLRFNRCVHDFDEEYGKFKKNKNYIKYFAKEIFCPVIESEEIKKNKEIMNFLKKHKTVIKLDEETTN